MDLSHGGHLTHGHPKNFSGMTYNVVPYGVDAETETIDYDHLEKTRPRIQTENDHCGCLRLLPHY